MKLKPGDMDQFIEAWKELDREATSFMPTKELRRLLFMLKWPNGFADYKELYGVEPQPRVVTERLRELAIPDRDGKLAFHVHFAKVGIAIEVVVSATGIFVGPSHLRAVEGPNYFEKLGGFFCSV